MDGDVSISAAMAAPAGVTANSGSANAPEAEHQQLLRKLQKAQRTHSELIAELDSVGRKAAKLRQERNLLMDKVYEREVATLEFTSGSSDEEESIGAIGSGGLVGGAALVSTLGSTGRLSTGAAAAPPTGSAHNPLIFHAVSHPTASSRPSPSTSTSMKREASEEHAALSHDHDGSGAAGGKKKRVVKTAEAAAATPRKVVAVPTDEGGQVILPVTIGVITLHSTGHIIWDRPAFHNKRYLWPVGYHTSRPYNSCVDTEAQTVYHSQILDGGTGPVFDVYADDNPDQHFQSPTPTGAWTAIVKQVNAVRGRDYTNSASGPDFFGLSNPTISMVLEGLPGAEKCSHYQRKVYEATAASSVAATALTSSSAARLALPKGMPSRTAHGDGSDVATGGDGEAVDKAADGGDSAAGEGAEGLTIDFD